MATTQSEFSSLVLVRSSLTIDKAKYATVEAATDRAVQWLAHKVQLPKDVVDRMQPRMERSIKHYYADTRAEYLLGLEVRDCTHTPTHTHPHTIQLDEEPPFDLRCSRIFS